MPSSKSVTQMLIDWRNGQAEALSELMPLVYDELHRLADHYLRRERPGHTLQATALVHEVYLRLVDQKEVRWQDRAHFLAIAANLMRQILINHAYRHQAAKRGGTRYTLSLDEATGMPEDGVPYYIMDYVDGLPVDVYSDTQRLPTVERLTLFRTVCSAVQYAHEHHIIHRDLKPSNILVTADDVPKLLDFGIAKVFSPELSSGITSTTALRPMTPEYASPEQMRGETITLASDIYSLGVLLYELLTGHHPYRVQGRTPEEIERIICEQEPEKPSIAISRVECKGQAFASVQSTRWQWLRCCLQKLGFCAPHTELAGDLDNIVLMALCKEPERRYASVEQFSEDIHRHLDGRPVIARKDTLWYRSAKFIKRSKTTVLAATLSAVIVLAFVVGFYLLVPREKALSKAIDSIAVLPFVNTSADPNMEYLSDGITESLINGLSQLPKLRVMARTTMFSYKGREVDPQKVGRDLKVRAVLTGRVLQRGDTLVVQADLVDTSDGSQLWGQQYNRKLSDILTVHEEIAREISEKMRLTSQERAQLTKRYTDNIEAYQLYLNGRYCLTKRTEEGFKRAIEYFERTSAKDPSYALAYSGLSYAYILLAVLNALPPREVYPKAKEAAEKALAIDDRLAEAYTALGYVKMLYEWDRSGAERVYQRALELSPNNEEAHLAYALYLGAMGREREAIAEIKRAQELDPLSQPISTVAGIILYWARRYDQAAEQFRNTIEVEPNFWPHLWLGQVYAQKGMHQEALEEARKARELSGDEWSWLLGYVYAVSGEREAAQKVIAELKDLSKRRYISPYDIAQIYAGLGEKDRVFEWLEKAYEDRSRFIDNLKVNPAFDPVRTDARFADFLRRVNLSP